MIPTQVAEDDGRHEDALAAHGAVLASLPDDGDALFGRARVAAWADRWSAGDRLMRDALARAPGHARIREHVAASDAYHAGPCGAFRRTLAFRSVEVGDVEEDGGRAYVAEGVLAEGGCREAISAAEAHASKNGGWTTARHFAVPTTDVPVHAVPAVLAWFNRALADSIFPALGRWYGVDPSRLRVVDAFLVKYDAAARRSLPLHCDQSELSITLPLNGADAYDGGGTFFHDLGEALNAGAGGLVAFPGHLTHGGTPITRGTRFVIVAFLYEYVEAGEDDFLADRVAALSPNDLDLRLDETESRTLAFGGAGAFGGALDLS